MMRRPLFRAAMIVPVLALCTTPLLADVVPSAEEAAALRALQGNLQGTIVWESNRTGAWELYAMNADGTGARQLTFLGTPGDPLAYDQYMRPRISPDGTRVLFAWGKKQAPVEAWILDLASGDARPAMQGNPLNWLPDGSGFFALRKKQIWRYDLGSGQESLALPTVLEMADASASMVGYVLPDLSAGVFRFKKNYYVRLPEGTVIRELSGCEPALTEDGRFLYWVVGPKNFRVLDTVTNEEWQLMGTPPVAPYNYTYFPVVSEDRNWIVYGASPGDHSHTTSDYEIFIDRLQGWRAAGEPVRLTFDKATDRWPFLWVGGSGGVTQRAASAPAPAAPPPLLIAGFPSDGAAPDWGGEWGLWPQVDGCGGEAAWVAEDAEGGRGGSLRISYSIEKEPRSFSTWFSPGRNVNLSPWDRFVIYARGDVPSFTFVVKDRNSDPQGNTEVGVAEIVVTGVTGRWQRFELAFSDFVPRLQSSEIDWRAINHLGVAMIAGSNATSGTLEIDNLQAVAAD